MSTRALIHWFVTLCLVLAGTAAGVSRAQTPGDAAIDPPERVGRLSAIEGAVQAWNESQQAWQPAQLNLPVTSRSAFLTSPGARAEVKVGSAALRLDADSQANLLRLDDGGTDIDVPRGTVGIRLRASADPAWQVAVRNTVVSLASPGSYRIDFDPARGLLVTKVFEGRAEIEAAGTRTLLTAGQQSSFDLANGQPAGLTALVRTPFDDWSALRDREQDRLQAWRYVSPEMTGADSLDAAGDWRADPSYGPVWYPNAVPAGWAPYSTGRWVWMPPWGWNWVDDAPWGFAPFHYGRWVLVDRAWGWVPGPYVRRPVYAPALVGFYGDGGRVGFAPGFGNSQGARIGVGAQHGPVAGWFPLAPGESWHPPYRASGGYLQNLNLGQGHGRALRNAGAPGLPAQPYRYAPEPHASTLVPQASITTSRGVWSNRLTAPGGFAGGPMQGQVHGHVHGQVQGQVQGQVHGPMQGPMQGPTQGYRPGERLDRSERTLIAPPLHRNAAPSPQAYAPPAQQAYGSPGRQLYAPPTHQAFAPPVRQAFAPPVHQAFAPPAHQAFAPPVHQAYSPPLRPTYVAPMQQAPAPTSRAQPGGSGHSGSTGGSGGGSRGGWHHR